jgi:glycosyltransferase involved in cell wall biosynthesis
VTDRPLVSLILACYNQEQFVAEAVESVLAQTYSPLEILIVDDCSPDGTLQVIGDVVAKHGAPPNVRVHRNERNLTVAYSSPQAIEKTSGEFIVIASGDDILLPNMVEEVVAAWQRERVSLVITNAIYIDENSQPLGKTYRDAEAPFDESFETLARDGANVCCFGPCMSFERRLYQKFGWPPAYLEAADIIYPYFAYLLGGAKFLPTLLFKYRVHSKNTSLTLIAERQEEELERLKVLEHAYYIHLAHAQYMRDVLDELRVKEPAYSETALRIFPLLDIQTVETAKRFVNVRRALWEKAHPSGATA